MMEADRLEQLEARLRRVEDELAIRRLVLAYGPAADAGMATEAAGIWAEDGVYDWDADARPHVGRDAIDRMLQSDAHLGLIAGGAAHFVGPLLVEIDGDQATAATYSLVMRREDSRFHLWRVSAVRWDLERSGSSWEVRRRTNRLLDEAGHGRELFAAVTKAMQGSRR